MLFAMNARGRLNELFEAASGDVADDGTEPVVISLRENCKGKPPGDVVRLRVQVENRRMTAVYEVLDPALSHAEIVLLFGET
jgi:hypothetical protein